MEHHIASLPSLLQVSQVLIDRQPQCMALKHGITVPSRILPKVCTSDQRFSSTWRPSKRSRPCMAGDRTRPDGGRSVSRTSPTSASMPRHPHHWMGIRCRRLGRRDRVDAGPGCGWSKRPRLRRGHFTAQHSLDNPSKNTKRKRLRGCGRQDDLPPTCRTRSPPNAEMNSVGPVTRQPYTVGRDAFVAWARTMRRWTECWHAA